MRLRSAAVLVLLLVAGCADTGGTAPADAAVAAIGAAVAGIEPTCGTVATDDAWPEGSEAPGVRSPCVAEAVAAGRPSRVFVTGRDAEGGALLADYAVSGEGDVDVTRWHATSTGDISSSATTCSPPAQDAYGAWRLDEQGTVVHTGGVDCLPGPDSDSLGRAVALLGADGAVPGTTSTFRTTGLRALEGRGRVYFFDDGEFVGTDLDTVDPPPVGSARSSGSVRVLWQDGATVGLGYGLWRPGEASCCPTGGEVTVRFRMVAGALVSIDPVPPARRPDEPLGR